jgi:hypothetical protein
MTCARIVCLAAACASLNAASLFADQTVAPTPVRPPAIVHLRSPWLADLRRIAATGDGGRLVAAGFEALADLRVAIGGACCDPSKNYFLLTFVGADAAGTPTLITVIVHDPMPASIEFPGLHGAGHPLYQLFLSDDLTASLQATFAIAHEENPAEKQAGDFAAAIIGHLALPLPLAVRSVSPETARPSAQPFDVAVAFDRIVLPEAGRITLHETVTYADPMRHLSARIALLTRTQSVELEARRQAGAPVDACAALSATLKDRVGETMAGAGCGLFPTDLTACTKKIRETIANAASTYFAAAPACPPDAGAPLVQDVLSVVQDVKTLTSTSTIDNAPAVRYSFGLAAAYIAGIDVDNAHPRAEIRGGRIVSAPFPRQLTMGVVNLTPWGFDAQRPSPSLAERARLVAGVAFSPYFGLTAGGAFAINRYLAIDAGYARLWFDTPKPGESIDAPPTSGNRAAPFDLRSTGAIFLGVAYNFK